MKVSKQSNRVLLLACLTLRAVSTSLVIAQQQRAAQPPAPPAVADPSKTVAIEPATKTLLRASATPAPAARPASSDPTKVKAVEPRVKAVVAELSAPAASDNPKVEPGKVHWHPSFAAACVAAQKSGKPVLLFHMMGKLDDQFC